MAAEEECLVLPGRKAVYGCELCTNPAAVEAIRRLREQYDAINDKMVGLAPNSFVSSLMPDLAQDMYELRYGSLQRQLVKTRDSMRSITSACLACRGINDN